jgi:rod shape determining protein RodA
MSLMTRNRRPRSSLGSLSASPADPWRNIDWVLLVAMTLTSVIGVAAVYSSTRPLMLRQGLDPYLFAERQVVFFILAAGALALVMAVDYRWVAERSAALYGATLLALVLVLIVGAVKSGARLSFDVGPIAVQPAELAKASVLVALAWHLAEERSDEVSYTRFVSSLVLVGAPVVLIVLQPDLGGASVLVAAAVGVLLVAGAKIRYIVLISTLGLITLAAALFAGLVDRYQLGRLEAFFNQNSTDARLQRLVYQVRFAKRAVSTGGITGQGWLEGPLTNGGYVPLQWSDFVFSAVCEQFGMIGGGVLLVLFAVMLLRIWRTAQLSKDRLGTFICAGVFTMLLWQVFQNIGMTMGIMPVTGLPLPLVSYGGSGAVAWAIMFGLVQNVHMRRLR